MEPIPCPASMIDWSCWAFRTVPLHEGAHVWPSSEPYRPYLERDGQGAAVDIMAFVLVITVVTIVMLAVNVMGRQRA